MLKIYAIDTADDKVADPFAHAHQVLRCAAQGPCPVCYDLQKFI